MYVDVNTQTPKRACVHLSVLTYIHMCMYACVGCRYVDAVLTIPKGVLYSNCGMNLAFDREMVG